MGNSASSSGRGHHDESVDFGQLTPQGIYTGPRDWNQAVVSQLICARRLAPFYRPLEEYDESWDDDQILAARKELPDAEGNTTESAPRLEATPSNVSRPGHSKRSSMLKEPSKPEAAVYRGAVECPICFLYYPPNINHSRCCDQAICTECFVQIKRSEPTTTHLVSEPAACPYCVQDNFGVVYAPPPWRAGIGSEGMTFPWSDAPRGSSQSIEASTPFPTHKRRQKSFGHESPEVVTTDQIRPDWEAKLAAVRAAVTRRANRRIIMRQVGDRLIPVGVTSGRVHPISTEEGQTEGIENGGSRRSRRRQQQQQQQQQNQGFDQFLGSMGIGGPDLEELMVMEAMRLSLLDHEEQQRKEAEEKKKKDGTSNESAQNSDTQSAGPGPSTLEARSSDQVSALTNLTPSPPSSQNSPSPSSTPRPSCESLSVQRNPLTPSRSRTPSPPPTNPTATLLSLDDASTAWRRRTSSPPPFGTPSAAPSASAIPGDDSSTSAAASGHGNAFTTKNGPPMGGSVPTIRIGNSTILHDSNGTPAAISPEADSSQRPAMSSSSDSFASSMFSTESSTQFGSSYDQLPSSPESTIAHEPLLGRGTQPETMTPTKGAVTEGESGDYFSEMGRQG